ncbi:MAG: NUDIX domain-containing protein [Bermanella sp.]
MSHYITPSFDYCPNCGAKTRLIQLEAQQLKSCSAKCGFTHFNNPTPVAAVIVETPEGVVLAHNVAWPEGMRSIITGFVDPLELPIDTAVRETQEELGLKAYDVRYVGQYMFKAKNQLIIAYAVKAQGDIQLNHELDSYKVVPVEKLKGWPGATGEAVSDWLNMMKPSRKTSG